MAKNTILALVSIITSLLNTVNFMIWSMVFDYVPKETRYPIQNTFYLLDISTNFFCIILTLAMNKWYYSLFCSCLHNKCLSMMTAKSNVTELKTLPSDTNNFVD